MKAKSLNFVALDIGSSKIAGIATYIDKKGETRVLSQTLKYSAGFKSSEITDLQAAEESILGVIYDLEQQCEKSIRQINISLCGNKTKSYYVTCRLKLNNQPITKSDIRKLIEKALQEFKIKDEEIISYFPIEFGIDENNFIRNPIGLLGRELNCQLHIIAASSNLMLNLTNCLARCHIEISNVVLAVHASALACLSEDEKNLGSIIIDMGAKTTSFGIFWLEKLIYSGSIDLGGFHITSDIAKIFTLSLRNAEKLKILHGSALPTSFDKNKMISIEELEPDNLDNLPVGLSLNKLSEVIQSRLEEILLRIKQQYDNLAMDHLISRRLIITGGGSALKGLREFSAKIFDRQVRIAKPNVLPGFIEDYNPAAYATVIGIIQNYSLRQQKNYVEDKMDEQNNNWMSKTIAWIKENI